MSSSIVQFTTNRTRRIHHEKQVTTRSARLPHQRAPFSHLSPLTVRHPTMTPQDKIDLINRVAAKAHEETESWSSEDQVGTALAYLFWAICEDDGNALDCAPPLLILFADWFPPSDPVWQFINQK